MDRYKKGLNPVLIIEKGRGNHEKKAVKKRPKITKKELTLFSLRALANMLYHQLTSFYSR